MGNILPHKINVCVIFNRISFVWLFVVAFLIKIFKLDWYPVCPIKIKKQKWPSKEFLKRGILKTFSKFTGTHSCRSAF